MPTKYGKELRNKIYKPFLILVGTILGLVVLYDLWTINEAGEYRKACIHLYVSMTDRTDFSGCEKVVDSYKDSTLLYKLFFGH